MSLRPLRPPRPHSLLRRRAPLLCSSSPAVAMFLLLALGSARAAEPAIDVSGALSWRLVGPFRGGWATVAAGVPAEPDTFYFGAAGGGVWKTVDAGRTFAPIFDAQPAAVIGALAVAPSDARVVYVGTGQPETRYDIAAGNGVYRSGDGGATWRHVGLDGTRHIGDILVDPRDPEVVLVAALGHIFGPNPERGVFRTTDGGKTWRRTLVIDDAHRRGRARGRSCGSARRLRRGLAGAHCIPGSATSRRSSARAAPSINRATAASPGRASAATAGPQATSAASAWP